MNGPVHDILVKACRGKANTEYVFANPLTGQPYTDVKHAFATACKNAGIVGLWWHDLRATFGTRLEAEGHGISTIMSLMG
jgi:integrase